MQISQYFFQVFVMDAADQPVQLRGTAFLAASGGGLMTCRHVVDLRLGEGEYLAVKDLEKGAFRRVDDIRFAPPKNLDLALLSNVVPDRGDDHLPFLEPNKLVIGEDVHSFGFYALGRGPDDVESGYFRGAIVNVRQGGRTPGDQFAWTYSTLQYPVIEGMSGCPVLTAHNGPKVVGICYGSVQQRVTAAEITEIDDGGNKYVEKTDRIVELGLSYHPQTIWVFLELVSATGFTFASGPTSTK